MNPTPERGGTEDVNFLGDIPVDVVIDDVVELDQPMDRPLDLVVGGRVLARGELVMVGERVALRVTELVGRGQEQS